MKAPVLTAPQTLELQDIEKPSIRDDEVLVKLSYCGICTLEQRLYTGAMKIFYPLVLGHEASGRVEEVGSRVLSSLQPGTKVALDLVTRCNECYFCRTGNSNLCENRFKKGQKVLGGFAEYIAVKATQVFPVPESLDLKIAAFAEPVACCIRSLQRLRLTLAEDLLIIGAGPMGLMHLQVALAMGARVLVADVNEKRLQDALALGAFGTVNPAKEKLAEVVKERTEGRGADACVVTTAAHSALKDAFDSVRKGGRINIYTSYGDAPELPMDANTLHRNEYLVTGTEGRTAEDFHKAVRLLSFGIVKVDSLVSKTVSMEKAEEGIQAAMSEETFRVLLAHGQE
ncbi:MAG: alcohol dehydrogenase catalytic domain-containing protein [Spirochaetales bacterium]|nr:alcohol dehydrogenase catalytic domain-containing protein [Spirochaetales bacterium]